jgi:hypothetical protein
VPGDSVEIRVYSPATKQAYTMACVRSDNRVTCRGGNNAEINSYVGQRLPHPAVSPAVDSAMVPSSPGWS